MARRIAAGWLCLVGGLMCMFVVAGCGGGDSGGSNEPAPAPTGKVTLGHFDHIRTGMSYEDVEKLIGAPGKLVSEGTTPAGKMATYTWEGEKAGTQATVVFRDGKVVQKAPGGLQ